MESVYGVQLLDDLHAYFPDILYEPERFESVQDLLGYIREQAQEHFNLYNRGRRLHAASRGSPAPAASAAASPSASAAPASATAPAAPTTAPAASAASAATPAAPAATPAASAAGLTTTSLFGRGAGAGSAMPSPFAMQSTPLYTSFYQSSRGLQPPSALSTLLFNFETDRDDPAMNLLGSLFGPALMGNGGRGLAANFMDPVVVRPTRDQIAAATDVIVLDEALETNCAICQDRMEAQNPTRKIRACGHSFHTECIDTWFERSVSCPVCRHDIRELATNANANTNADNGSEGLSDVE